MVKRCDWPVARIDTGWTKTNFDDWEQQGHYPAIVRAVRNGREFGQSDLMLFAVSPSDYRSSGGHEKPPSHREGISWRPTFLVYLAHNSIQSLKANLWVHPDILSWRASPEVLAEFVPTEVGGEPEVVSAREFLTMWDHNQTIQDSKSALEMSLTRFVV